MKNTQWLLCGLLSLSLLHTSLAQAWQMRSGGGARTFVVPHNFPQGGGHPQPAPRPMPPGPPGTGTRGAPRCPQTFLPHTDREGPRPVARAPRRASLTARSVFSIVSHVERPSLTVCRDGTRHGSTYPPARGAQGRARTP